MAFWNRRAKVETVEPDYRIEGVVVSDIGCCREENEDNGVFVMPDDPVAYAGKGALLIVADGVGGHAAGATASRLAVETVRRAYYGSRSEPRGALEDAVREANREIFLAAGKALALQGMGTTCTALSFRNGEVVNAHVGDSRLYLLREGGLYQMTEDHSAVMELVRQGALTPAEARSHPERNVILRALGTHADVEVSSWGEPFPARAGDRFLLCTDGLYDLVEDDEIRDRAGREDVESACRELVSLARERGGYDNITVGLLALVPAGEPERRLRDTREAVVGV